MPPHSPFEASPIGMLTTPGTPMCRTGTWGKSLANRNPNVVGKNPGTALPLMSSPPACGQPIGRVPRIELGHHPLHQRRRGHPELVAQDRPESLVLAEGLPPVPFRQVRANQGPVRALPQRLPGDACQPRLRRLGEAPRGRELVAQTLQRVQTELPESLPLEHHPVIRPSGQEVAGEDGGARAEGARMRWATSDASRRSTAVPPASPSRSFTATTTGRTSWRRRHRAERRLAPARSSDASGHRVPATNGRLTNRSCSARKATRRSTIDGTGMASPSRRSSKPRSSRTETPRESRSPPEGTRTDDAGGGSRKRTAISFPRRSCRPP